MEKTKDLKKLLPYMPSEIDKMFYRQIFSENIETDDTASELPAHRNNNAPETASELPVKRKYTRKIKKEVIALNTMNAPETASKLPTKRKYTRKIQEEKAASELPARKKIYAAGKSILRQA